MVTRLNQPTGSVGIDLNRQSIARLFGVKTETVEHLETGVNAANYSLLFEEDSQTVWNRGDAKGDVKSWSVASGVCSVVTTTGTYKLTRAFAPVSNGGTGAGDAAGARRNLGVMSAEEVKGKYLSLDGGKITNPITNDLPTLTITGAQHTPFVMSRPTADANVSLGFTLRENEVYRLGLDVNRDLRWGKAGPNMMDNFIVYHSGKKPTAADVGLGNVNNSADKDKQVASAVKLQTARSIQVKLDSGSAVNFDGTANVQPGISGKLGIANGGTGAIDAAGARGNLGLKSAALKNTGTSGDAVPLLNAANTWSATQTFSAIVEADAGVRGRIAAVSLLNQKLSLDSLTLGDGALDVVHYICQSDGGGANITGRPEDNYKNAFSLKVELIRYARDTDFISKQTYIRGTEAQTWERYCNSGKWTPWTRGAQLNKESTWTARQTFSGGITGELTGNAATATKLKAARNIGGVAFDGTADIDLPGVNKAGNQNTTGNAATATKLGTPRSLWGNNFDGTGNVGGTITVNGNDNLNTFFKLIQGATTTDGGYLAVGNTGKDLGYVEIGTVDDGDTSIVARKRKAENTIIATAVLLDGDNNTSFPGVVKAKSFSGEMAGNASTATKLLTARKIGGVMFDGTADINLPGVNTSGNQPTTGNAGSATKLQTARSIQVKLDSGSPVNFDGTANVQPGISGKLGIANGGTGAIDAAGARKNLGLKSAALLDAGTAAGNVMEVGAFGLGGTGLSFTADSDGDLLKQLKAKGSCFLRASPNKDKSVSVPAHGSGFFSQCGDTNTLIIADYASANITVVTANDSGIATPRVNRLYGTANKPKAEDVGLGNVLNSRQLVGANNLSDLPDRAKARTNLGLGSAALKNIGTSGDAIPLMNTANTWSADQNFNSVITGKVLRASGVVSFKPVTQGAHVSWNRESGSGRMEFINHRGGGTGGFNFWNGTESPTIIASIDGGGSAVFAGGMTLGKALSVASGGTGASDAKGARKNLELGDVNPVITLPAIGNGNVQYLKIATVKNCGNNAGFFQVKFAGAGGYGGPAQNFDYLTVSCRGVNSMTEANVATYVKHSALVNTTTSPLRVVAAPSAVAGEFDIYVCSPNGWWNGTTMQVCAITGGGTYISGLVQDNNIGAVAWSGTVPAKSFTTPCRSLLTEANIGTSGDKVPLLNGANTWSGSQSFPAGIGGKLTIGGDTVVKGTFNSTLSLQSDGGNITIKSDNDKNNCNLWFRRLNGTERAVIWADASNNLCFRTNVNQQLVLQSDGWLKFDSDHVTDAYHQVNMNRGQIGGLVADNYFFEQRGQYHGMGWHLYGASADQYLLLRSDSLRFEGSSANFYLGGNLDVNNVYIRSDKRAKSNIKRMKLAVDKVDTLSGNTYDLEEGKGTVRSAGLIAQEVLKVLPEAVTQDSEEDGGLYRLNYNGVVGLLVEAVRELSARLRKLEAITAN
ncbi:tail fiber domain-containing protein [Raoultella ornithinolytica]|uniref:tail fiber domain-containing protein n=1 Tax=Raoultella ornithinolytica TaxID=54291 RepID=UPI00292C8D82|nr:tail fiber domain-containing protein [Raoultella ornithinolytica]MDV1094943.1 tail fiber domain-containing protein [Raoultella ornithinolytica]MDV1122713.1 tail fiber domain-containing protein [Raoultella ornithinolytica]MDV1893228.1 tail fiber domain-containing protein [Raoultella ornithinolytica]